MYCSSPKKQLETANGVGHSKCARVINPVTTKIVLKVSKQRKRIKVCCDFAASLDQLLLLLRGASAGSTESARARAIVKRETTRTGVGGPRPGGPLRFR